MSSTSPLAGNADLGVLEKKTHNNAFRTTRSCGHTSSLINRKPQGAKVPFPLRDLARPLRSSPGRALQPCTMQPGPKEGSAGVSWARSSRLGTRANGGCVRRCRCRKRRRELNRAPGACTAAGRARTLARPLLPLPPTLVEMVLTTNFLTPVLTSDLRHSHDFVLFQLAPGSSRRSVAHAPLYSTADRGNALSSGLPRAMTDSSASAGFVTQTYWLLGDNPADNDTSVTLPSRLALTPGPHPM